MDRAEIWRVVGDLGELPLSLLTPSRFHSVEEELFEVGVKPKSVNNSVSSYRIELKL